MKVPIAMLSRCRLAAYSRGLSSMGAARALSTHPTISPDGEAAYPEGTKQKIGPKLATDRGLAGEKGQLPRRWIDEPVPANSMSAMKEFPGTPILKPGRNLAPPKVQISTLSNGMRVATQDSYGQVATFAMFVDAGSMYENQSELGACHFLESTSFKSTEKRSAADVLSFQMANGMGSSAVFNREVVMYKVDTLRNNSEAAVDLLSDAVQHPKFSDEEMEQARQVIQYQRDEAMGQPQFLASEHLYVAAYGEHSPLGRPEKCPESKIGSMTASTLRQYMQKYFVAPRMVLSAVNVDHDVAVRLAERYFNALPTAAPANSGAIIGRPKASYLGGDVRSSPDWSSVPATAAAAQAASKTEFTHIMLALPTVGWSHDDVVPVCVVDTLLGGGSSFSAGGPGKGMYSRLYREVLNKYGWVESANAFSAQLYDCGIVGIYGAAPPESIGSLAGLLCEHVTRLCTSRANDVELSRAANQLASSVLMNLETRGLLVEDIGRQILCHGKRLDPAELVHRIKSVKQEDIQRVMQAALEHPPSFAAVGEAKEIPEYDQLKNYFQEATHKWKTAGTQGIAPSNGGGKSKTISASK